MVRQRAVWAPHGAPSLTPPCRLATVDGVHLDRLDRSPIASARASHRRIADIGAAVIGTGFIGTVHVEELRRIGVQVRGVLGSTPERGAARAAALGVGARLSHARRAPRRPRRRRRPRDVAEPPPRPPGTGDPRRRQARRLREAAGDDRRRIGRARRGWPRESGLVNAVNFNIRFYPLHQHVRELVADGGLGDVRFVTGHYFQDWLLLDTDWNWRLEPDKGGALRAVGDIGSHWLDLVTVPDRPADRRRHGRPGDVRRASARSPPGPVETFSTERSADTVAREMATEDVASILLRFDNGARGAVSLSQISAGRKNSLQWEIDGSTGAAAWDSETPDHLWLGPPRPAERDPAAQPGADGPGRSGRVGPAGRPRRGLRRHVRCALPGDLRRRRRRRARPIGRRTPPSPTATTRCSSTTRSRDSAPRGPLGRRRSRAGVAPAGPSTAEAPLMRLGFLTAPFPDTPLMEVADWAAATGFEVLEIACWPRDRPDAPLRRHEPHRRREPVRRPGDATSVDEIEAKGLAISGLGFYPNPLHPDPEHRESVIGHLKLVIEAAEKMDIPLVNTFMGGDGAKTPGRQLGGGAPGLAGHRRVRAATTAGSSRSRTARCCSPTTNGRAATTSRRRPGCGAGSSSSGAARSG